MQFTEQQISAVARVLSDRAAGDCGVHKEDNWDIYSDHYLEDAKAALAAASAAAPQVVADERDIKTWHERLEKHNSTNTIFKKKRGLLWDAPDAMLAEIKELRAALSSALVQDKEPVSGTAVEAVLLSDMVDGAHHHQYGKGLFTTENCITTLYTTPVQPVAVPDGWVKSDVSLPFDGVRCLIRYKKNYFLASIKRAFAKDGPAYWGNTFNKDDDAELSWAKLPEVEWKPLDGPAAPAAQGDAKEPTDAELLAAFNDILHRDYAHSKDYDLAIGRAAIAAKAAS